MPVKSGPMAENLVGYLEIAMRAGVKRSVVNGWRKRTPSKPPFPAPVAELRIGPVWWWPDVKAWLISTGRPWDVNLPAEEVRPTLKTRAASLAALKKSYE